MSITTRVLLSAVAFVLAGCGGTSPIPSARTTPLQSETPSAAPSPTPTPTASPILLTDSGELAPGTYLVHPFIAPNESTSVRFTLPSGWETEVWPTGRVAAIWPVSGYSAPNGLSIGFVSARTLEADPCHWTAGSSNDVEIGTTPEEHIEAFSANPGYDATSAPAVVGDMTATRIDLEVPPTLDLADCRDGQFWVWGDGADGASIYSQGPRGKFHFWIVDADEKTVVVQMHDHPATPPETVAQAKAIVDSMIIEP
jgi:hypothetical protein